MITSLDSSMGMTMTVFSLIKVYTCSYTCVISFQTYMLHVLSFHYHFKLQYDFHDNLKTSFLPRLQKNIAATSDTPCGTVGHIFTTRVAQYINHTEK